MGLAELIDWQWNGYPRYHAGRTNLLIHIVAVPLVLLGNVALVRGLLWLSPSAILGGAVAMGAGLVLQGRGHRLEKVPSEPFTGPGNAVARLLVEQWVTFPKFVFSGGWARALRDAK